MRLNNLFQNCFEIEKCQLVYKPDFVRHSIAARGNHSSRTFVAKHLLQPTRMTSLKTDQSCDHAIPIWFCSRWGLPCQHRYRHCGALLPHPFTLTTYTWRFAFCGTFPKVTLAGSYPAPCFSWSPDFPPQLALQRLPDQLTLMAYWYVA